MVDGIQVLQEARLLGEIEEPTLGLGPGVVDTPRRRFEPLPLSTGVDGMSGSESGQRVLVVDDDEKVRQFLTDLLSHDGHTVDSAGSAPAAIRLLLRNRYSLLITDVEMPETSGLELTLVQFLHHGGVWRVRTAADRTPRVPGDAPLRAALTESRCWSGGQLVRERRLR